MEQETGLVAVHNKITKLIEEKIDAMPKDFNKTRFIQNAMTVLVDNKDKVSKMNPDSVARTILKGAFLGLDFFNKECYAIPYGNELTFQTDYKGEIKLAKKYSSTKIKDIYAKIVREGDVFDEVIMDGKQSISFKPIPFNNGKILGAFAVAYFADDSMIYETMSVEEVEHIRKTFSKQSTGKAWTDSFGEMTKKTVLRRLCKLIDLNFDSAEMQKTYQESADSEFKKKKEEIKATSSLDVQEAEAIDVESEVVEQ